MITPRAAPSGGRTLPSLQVADGTNRGLRHHGTNNAKRHEGISSAAQSGHDLTQVPRGVCTERLCRISRHQRHVFRGAFRVTVVNQIRLCVVMTIPHSWANETGLVEIVVSFASMAPVAFGESLVVPGRETSDGPGRGCRGCPVVLDGGESRSFAPLGIAVPVLSSSGVREADANYITIGVSGDRSDPP